MISDSSNHPLDADPPENVAPRGLPRLQVIHLMLWMAATAVAFLPYQLQRRAQSQISPGAEELTQSVSATAVGVASGMAAGAYLFVSAALWYWRRQGRAFRLQPGHWFAFEGVGEWAMAAGLWLILLNSEGSSYGLLPWLMIPRLIVGLGFFACFLWLALRSQEPARWRWTFAATALTPVAAWFLTMVAAFTGLLRGRMTAFMIPNVAAAGLLALILVMAMAGDARNKTDRHWSHWLSIAMRLAALAATGAMYAYYSLFPQAITGN
jgi:hypothetical protein